MDRKPLTAMDMLSQLPNEAGIAFEVFQALEKQDLEELNVHELAILAQFKIQLRRGVETAAADERRLEEQLQAEREGRQPAVRVVPVFGLPFSIRSTESPGGPDPPSATPKQD